MSQSPGYQDPFEGPIKRVLFKNGKYRQGPKLNTPSIYGTHFILYGLTQQDLNGNGVTETIVLDNNYHLRVYSTNGRLVVKSSDYYGHDPRLIEVGIREDASGVVRQGDPQFKDIVAWSVYAMMEADESGVTSKNVDKMKKSKDANIARLLGNKGKLGVALGLDNDWAYRIIKQVGNYGEIFERNVGKESPLKLPRGLNDLWTRGGLLYSPPFK